MTSNIAPIPTIEERVSRRFDIAVRGFLACDAVMLLFLTFGYISPSHISAATSDQTVTPIAEELKASPFRIAVKTTSPRRQPQVVYTRGQAVSEPQGDPQLESLSVPQKRVVMPPISTAIALPVSSAN